MFYVGVFYPCCSPLYRPEEYDGACFAAIGQPENYHGFLYQEDHMLAAEIFYQ